MTAEKKVARRKLSLLELATDLNNVSKACKVMGYSRQQFYEIRRNFQTFGAEGLLDRLGGGAWQAKKAKLKERIREIADRLMRIAAERAVHRCAGPADGLGAAFLPRLPPARRG